MKQYMIESDLPDVLSPEFIALIPEHRMMVDEMLRSGRLRTYTLSMDRSKLWAIVYAESELEALASMSELPLFPYFETYVHELMFHNSASEMMISYSLN